MRHADRLHRARIQLTILAILAGLFALSREAHGQG
jgi:hypothetical protein